MNKCEGCIDHKDCWLTDIENCPCLTCLVKVMCKKACELFDEFQDRHYKQQGGSFQI